MRLNLNKHIVDTLRENKMPFEEEDIQDYWIALLPKKYSLLI